MCFVPYVIVSQCFRCHLLYIAGQRWECDLFLLWCCTILLLVLMSLSLLSFNYHFCNISSLCCHLHVPVCVAIRWLVAIYYWTVINWLDEDVSCRHEGNGAWKKRINKSFEERGLATDQLLPPTHIPWGLVISTLALWLVWDMLDVSKTMVCDRRDHALF